MPLLLFQCMVRIQLQTGYRVRLNYPKPRPYKFLELQRDSLVHQSRLYLTVKLLLHLQFQRIRLDQFR
ncbi:Uncharacterized protein APZ42_009493 [Daphnia magna]|uniref:Uncharacterized protein n=1 Tax=Daphnia magna TaxID=35525 RepID=A0A164DZH8_9CRUS|nr:Uncharacterized protein APZ42_009493 [Daphnia magna]